jgi:hypothetical protein
LGHVEKMRRISGRNWDPERKIWIIPNNHPTLVHLLREFNENNVTFEPQLLDESQYARTLIEENKTTKKPLKINNKWNQEEIIKLSNELIRFNY